MSVKGAPHLSREKALSDVSPAAGKLICPIQVNLSDHFSDDADDADDYFQDFGGKENILRARSVVGSICDRELDDAWRAALSNLSRLMDLCGYGSIVPTVTAS
jgi:hypothetical protein